MRCSREVMSTSVLLCAFALGGCSVARQTIPSVASEASGRAAGESSSAGREFAQSSSQASSGICSFYAAYGTPAFCYPMAESSGTTLTDGSGAGHNGTISPGGVVYHEAALTNQGGYAERTDGSSGSLTSGPAPASGSFTMTFFVALMGNANNYGHLASTGSPSTSSPSSGWSIDIQNDSANSVFAKLGYGSGETTISGAALPQFQPTSVTLSYVSSTKVATLCVGGPAAPSCASATLPGSYAASGRPVVFGGGTAYSPVHATFDDAAYWPAALSSSQIGQIAALLGSGSGTPSPTPHPTSSAYAPAGGTDPYFASSPFFAKIPSPPTVNTHSSAWVSSVNQGGNFSLNQINVSATEGNNADHNYPIYYNHSGSNTPVTIHCMLEYVSGTQCNDEGMTVYIDPREKIQNNAESGQDDHLTIIDPVAGYEYVFWRVQTPFPPTNGVLTAAYSGRCSLWGDGFTNPSYGGVHWNSGCVGDESGYPLSVGIIRPEDLEAALNSSTGSLPTALSFGMTCTGQPNNGALPAPFLGTGSGKCNNSTTPIEGNRLYLAMHDSDVNALHLPKITSVILRTLDEDHYGAYLTDTGGSQPGVQLYGVSDNTYLTWGANDPWHSWFLPEAKNEGLPGATSETQSAMYRVSLPIPSSITSKVRFL